jgi:hypothetical protein
VISASFSQGISGRQRLIAIEAAILLMSLAEFLIDRDRDSDRIVIRAN